MKENKLKPFGRTFLSLSAGALLLASGGVQACQKSFSQEENGYEVNLQLKGDCQRGMYTLQFTTPSGSVQSLYQVYKGEVSGVWMESLTKQDVPEVIITQSHADQLISLQIYAWKNDRYSKRWMEQPSKQQLDGYQGQDKVYVRWNQLIRQVKVVDEQGSHWRRLVYQFDRDQWQTEE